MRSFVSGVFGGMGTAAMFGIFILIAAGDLFWLWMAIQFGSFLMFFIGLFPITAIFIATPLGAWSLLFGAPDWLMNLFG